MTSIRRTSGEGNTKPARAPRRNPEADFQRALVRDLRLILQAPFVLSATPNEQRQGGERGRLAQALALSMGVHPGFADLTLMQGGRHLYLECKSQTGRLSKDQEAFRDFVLGQGHGWAEVRTLDEALSALSRFGFKTRIRNGNA